LVLGLADPDNHYMISANYYEYIIPGLPKSDRWYIAIIYVHQDSAWNVELATDGIMMDVILNNEKPEEKYRIRIPYEEVWQVQEGHSPAFTDKDQVFYDYDVLKKLPSYAPSN
jgi:hypothetical protein